MGPSRPPGAVELEVWILRAALKSLSFDMASGLNELLCMILTALVPQRFIGKQLEGEESGSFQPDLGDGTRAGSWLCIREKQEKSPSLAEV